MEVSISHLKNTHNFFPSPSMAEARNPPIMPKSTQIQQLPPRYRRLKLQWSGRFGCGSVVERAQGGSSMAELEAEMMKSEEEWFGIEEKCRGRRGIVELMECLEREAIMGEDEGKEASDYNRRAKIFDKSSRVFQALKEETKQS